MSRLSPEARKVILFDIVIFIFAFVLRILFWTSFEDRDFLYSLFYYGDSFRIHDEAIRILDSSFNSRHLPYHPPLTSYLLAVLYGIFGKPPDHLNALKISLITLGSLNAVVFHHLARRLFEKRLALIGAVLFGATFPMLVISVMPNTESVFLLLCMLTLLSFFRLTQDWKLRDAIFAGVLASLASLTRAEFASFFAVLFGGFVLQNWKATKLKLAIPILLISFVVPFVPWILRNRSVLMEFNAKLSVPGLETLSTFAPVTNYGPLNFAMANNILADGKFSRSILVGQEGALQLNNPQHRHYFIHGYEEGFKYIRSSPGDFLRLAWKKLSLFAQGFSHGFTAANLPSGLNGVRYPVDIFVSTRQYWKWIMLPLFAVGFVLSMKEWKRWWPLHLLFLHRVAVTIVFFGYVRGLTAVYFLVILFLIYPFRRLLSGIQKFDEQKVLISAIALFVLLSLIPVFKPVRFEASGPSDGRTGYLIQDAEIKIWPKQ